MTHYHSTQKKIKDRRHLQGGANAAHTAPSSMPLATLKYLQMAETGGCRRNTAPNDVRQHHTARSRAGHPGAGTVAFTHQQLSLN